METAWIEANKAIITSILAAVAICVTIALHFHKLRIEKRKDDKKKKPQDDDFLKELHLSTFISEYYQGEMLDRASLFIEIKNENEINGTFTVYFQEPWENEDAKLHLKRLYKTPVTLNATGIYQKNSTLCLNYQNNFKLANHSGTVLLCRKVSELVGYYITYHPDVPEARRTIPNEKLFSYGQATFVPSTPTLAEQFLKRKITLAKARITK